MTADTYSNSLGVLLMGTGNDNNQWGVNANNSVFQILEDAIANNLLSTVTGGTLDLSGSPPPAAASQARYARLTFIGTLTSTQTVIVPNLPKIWLIQNLTVGAFTLQFKASGGNPTQIPQGKTQIVWCDAGAGVFRLDKHLIGTFVDSGFAVPPGSLLCDGSAYSRVLYSDLWNKIGTVWGGGDGSTTFNVPNFTDTGRFRRAVGPSNTAVGQYQGNQNLTHSHGATSSTSVSTSDPGHGHTVSDPGHTHGFSDPGHNHVVNDPTHAHGVSDPGHNHGVSDPGHSHGVSDPTHTHGISISVSVSDTRTWATSFKALGFNAGSGVGFTVFNEDAPPDRSVALGLTGGGISASGSGTITAAATGISLGTGFTSISIAAAGTGIAIGGASTGIFLSAAFTGASIASGGTGITVANAATGITATGTTTTTITAAGGAEARPECATVNMCIWY